MHSAVLLVSSPAVKHKIKRMKMTANKTTDETNNIQDIGNIDDLWGQVVGVWEHGLLGVDISKIILALVIFTGFLIIRGVFTKYVLNRLHGYAANTQTKMDDKIIDALSPPIKFIPVIMGLFFASQYAELDEALGDYYIRLMRSLIAFTMFWGLHRALEPVSHVSSGLQKILSPTMSIWIFKALRVVLIFIGVAVILEIWGIQVGPLLAGLGIFGAAVALGAQDVFKNMIAGLTIIAEKKFQDGEWIKVDGVVEGTVEDIGFRSTMIRQFDKAPVQVPNSVLSDAPITNYSRMTQRRIKWVIGVEYRTTKEQLKIIRDEIWSYIESNDDFDKSVSTFVHINSFNDSSIDLLVYCFTKTTVWGEWLQIKEQLAYKIKEIVEEKAGTGFAFPSQSVYVESFPEDTSSEKAEPFTPPE